MVVSHKEPAQTVKERLKPLFKLPHIDDWTLAEACVDFTSYRNDHEDLRALTHQQVCPSKALNGDRLSCWVVTHHKGVYYISWESHIHSSITSVVKTLSDVWFF